MKRSIATLGMVTQYEIEQKGEVVARSERFKLGIDKSVTLNDPKTGEVLAYLKRDYAKNGILSAFVDNWDIELTEKGAKVLDPKVLFHVAAQDTLSQNQPEPSDDDSSKD